MKNWLCAVVISVFSQPLLAMSPDTSLSALVASDEALDSNRWTILDVGYDFAPDNVDYTPNLAEGGFAIPDSEKRFSGMHFGGKRYLGRGWLGEAGIRSSTLTSLRNQVDVSTVELAVQHQLPWRFADIQAAIRLGYMYNGTDVLHKNSYTKIEELTLTSLNVVAPKDQQLQMNLLMSGRFSAFQWTGFTGLGLSQVGYQSLNGTFKSGDCKYDFDLQKSSGLLTLAEPCGNLRDMGMYLPDEAAIISKVGVNPVDGLEYHSLYWQLGGNLVWRWGRFSNRVSYYLQGFDRDGVDDEIDSQGEDAFTHSHAFSLSSAYRLNSHISAEVNLQYDSSRLLNAVPFTYNLYSAKKYNESGLIVSSSLKFRL